MKARLVLFLLCLSFLSGCFQKVRLYPVSGPLSFRTPPPIYAAKIAGAFKAGNISATLENGEVCKGSWEAVSNRPTSNSNPSTSNVTSPDMTSAWDAVYGQGYYVAHVLGTRLHIHGVLNGDQGTILHVDAYRTEDANGDLNTPRGVAVDNKGNTYKMAF